MHGALSNTLKEAVIAQRLGADDALHRVLPQQPSEKDRNKSL